MQRCMVAWRCGVSFLALAVVNLLREAEGGGDQNADEQGLEHRVLEVVDGHKRIIPHFSKDQEWCLWIRRVRRL